MSKICWPLTEILSLLPSPACHCLPPPPPPPLLSYLVSILFFSDNLPWFDMLNNSAGNNSRSLDIVQPNFEIDLFICTCIGNHMISSAIWDKSARLNFSRANQFAQACRVSAICSLWKIYEYWFIPNWTRKIMWLFVNNKHKKTSLQVDDKQGVLSRLPFRIIVRTLRSCQAL